MVIVGDNTRIVSFATFSASAASDSSDSDTVTDAEALARAIRTSFEDIIKADQDFFCS